MTKDEFEHRKALIMANEKDFRWELVKALWDLKAAIKDGLNEAE